MEKIRLYFQETYNELMYKVTWPTWGELQSSAIVVLVGSIVITLIVWIMDYSSNLILTDFIYDLLAG